MNDSLVSNANRWKKCGLHNFKRPSAYQIVTMSKHLYGIIIVFRHCLKRMQRVLTTRCFAVRYRMNIYIPLYIHISDPGYNGYRFLNDA